MEEGKINGLYRGYHKNGSLFFELQIDHEKLVSINQYLSSDGKSLANSEFKNGNSMVNIYRPDGSLKARGKYINGFKEGPWYWVLTNGDTLEGIIYKRGCMLDEDLPSNGFVDIWEDGF